MFPKKKKTIVRVLNSLLPIMKYDSKRCSGSIYGAIGNIQSINGISNFRLISFIAFYRWTSI